MRLYDIHIMTKMILKRERVNHMPLPDWNHNGKRDAFDAFVDMKIIEEVNKAENDKKNSADTTTDCSSNYKKDDNEREITGISMGGKLLYDATKDSDWVVAGKCFTATAIIIAGIAIPVIVGMEGPGVIICIFGGLGLALSVLKNT